MVLQQWESRSPPKYTKTLHQEMMRGFLVEYGKFALNLQKKVLS
jgi:hypothetical protein